MRPTRLSQIAPLFAFAALQLLAGQAFAQPKATKTAAKPVIGPPTELTVSAAASLKDVLNRLGANYKKAHPNVKLRFNFAASGVLQRQIEQGAPVDLFISAAEKNMKELEQQKLVDAPSRRVFAGNTLVLVVPRSSTHGPRSFRELAAARVERVAIGAPQSVPAGKYAQEVLTKIGVWEAVRAKAIRGTDVRDVLTQVELGNVDAGIVYGSDAAISRKVRVVAVAPPDTHQPIRYPLAVVADSRRKPEAWRFSNYLLSPASKAVLRRYKFEVKY